MSFVTYHERHSGTLDTSRQQQQEGKHLPPALTLLSTAGQDGDVRHQGHALEHDGEGHQKADATPHGAEISIRSMAVVVLGEVFARLGDRGATFVEAICVVDTIAIILNNNQY